MALPTAISRPDRLLSDGDRTGAALEIVAIEQALARSGRTVLDELAATFVPGEHYPPGEVWDARSHAQYFYHAHADGDRRPSVEHGHFHTFLAQAGMPAGMTPLMLPEMALESLDGSHGRGVGTHRSPRDRGVVSHLVALSVDGAGRPIGLFTTNRWVTGETWFRADDVIRMLPRFELSGSGPTARIDRWLSAVLRVLRPQIAALVAERDTRIMDWRRRRTRRDHVFDDRRLEVVSERSLDFGAEMKAVLGRV